MIQNNNSLRYDLPALNEIEISLFGPGYGECILVHYGDGRWFTIDCCLESDKITPTPLAYLQKINANPKSNVTHIILTHPDGDHVGGISELFLACEAAELVCPSVLSERDMLLYASRFAYTDRTPLTRKTHELIRLLDHCVNRPPYLPIYAAQDRPLIHEAGVQLNALSPSDKMVTKFLQRIARLLPNVKADRRGPGKLRPNEVSVACLLSRGNFSAIFGADLEESPSQGWSTVLERSIIFRAANSCRIFKVSHHGSKNADLPELWMSMDEPIAILTPFKHGSHRIPTPDDVTRILSKSENAFSVASFRTQKIKRLSSIDKVLTPDGIKRRAPYPKNGHIRVRISQEGAVKIHLFDNAVHLSKVH